MKKLLFLITVVLSFSVQSQIATRNNDSFNELVFFVGTNNPLYNGAQGSRYLNEEFVPAKINDFEKVYPVRFNVVENVIEVKQNDGAIISLDKDTDYVVRLMDGSYKLYEDNFYLTEEGKEEKTFFQKVHKADGYELFLKERIKFIEKKPSKSSYEPEVPAKFLKLNDKYYVKDLREESKGVLIEVPQKKKTFLKVFNTESNKVGNLLKKSKSKFDKKEDLIKVLDVYFGAGGS
nr:hypothetical protein [uncultured Allomuricauda sp.]